MPVQAEQARLCRTSKATACSTRGLVTQMPRRTFVTGGPAVPEENYFVKRERELTDFLRRVEQGKYIVIFAPRQTGKPTFFYQALKVLEKDPKYIPISLDFEIYSRAEPERFYQIIGKKIIQLVNYIGLKIVRNYWVFIRMKLLRRECFGVKFIPKILNG